MNLLKSREASSETVTEFVTITAAKVEEGKDFSMESTSALVVNGVTLPNPKVTISAASLPPGAAVYIINSYKIIIEGCCYDLS
jgi:hypothetical protein